MSLSSPKVVDHAASQNTAHRDEWRGIFCCACGRATTRDHFANTKGQTMVDKGRRDNGLAMRKQVLGAAYVEKSLNNADAFSAPFQEWLNEHCWGVAWTDDRLSPKTRSMLNIALLAGINRMHEWELHLNGALNNGVTRDEIQAIIQHVAVYAGAPVGVECMRIARKVFAERDGK